MIHTFLRGALPSHQLHASTTPKPRKGFRKLPAAPCSVVASSARRRFPVGDEAYSMNPATPPCISKNPNNPKTANGTIKYAVPGVVTWGRVRPTVTRPKHWYATQKDR